MEVVDYLKSFRRLDLALRSLVEDHRIKYKSYADRFILNYEIDALKTNPIANECRSLILDYSFNILSRSFDRFFNYGELNNRDFDFSKSVITEKFDGSLINLYCDNNHNWSFSTRGTCFAEGETLNSYSYIGLIRSNVEINYQYFPCCEINNFYSHCDCDYRLNSDLTYIFELCSPHNKIVKQYETTFLAFLAARNKITGEYVDYNDAYLEINSLFKNIRKPKVYSFKNITEIQNAFKNFDPLDEGVVAFDGINRIKVKRKEYLTAWNIKNNFNRKDMLSIVIRGESEEFLTYFPEYSEEIHDIQDSYQYLRDYIFQVYDGIDSNLDQKSFALIAVKYPFSSVLFNLRNGIYLNDIMESMNPNKAIQLLDFIKPLKEVDDVHTLDLE